MRQAANLSELLEISPELYHTTKNLGLSRHDLSLFAIDLGGDFYVVESLEEVSQMIKPRELDIVAKSKNSSFMQLVSINNNGGGPTFALPMNIFSEWHDGLNQEDKAYVYGLL